MKEITLTKGYVALVDDEDYEELNKYKWWVYVSVSNKAYAVRQVSRKTIYMHTQISGIKGIDHIDRNGLNNQKYNFRFATASQQVVNRVVVNKTGYRGVHKRGNNYVADIKFNKIKKYIGIYKTDLEAAKAYDMEAKKLHGAFAVLNNV